MQSSIADDGRPRSSTTRAVEPGRYRVGVSANWLNDDPPSGDVYVLSRAGHRDGSVAPSRNCCSSSASRWARIVFWSESREMTVE